MANLPKEVYLTVCVEPKEEEEEEEEELAEEEEEEEEAAAEDAEEAGDEDEGAEPKDGEEAEERPPTAADGGVSYEKEVEEVAPIEIELTSASLIGDLKDKLNSILGKLAGFDKEEIAELPRMALMTGRRIWSDLEVLKAVISEVGCLSELKYGTIKVILRSVDLRDPPKRSKAEEEDMKRIAEAKETAARERSRTRRVRPTKRGTDSFATSTTSGDAPGRESSRRSAKDAK